MSRTLREELADLVSRWRMPQPQAQEPLTFESIRDDIEQELRLRAKNGCSTWGAHLSTDRFGGGIGCLGTTGDPDKDEEIMRQVAAWLEDQGLIVDVERHDKPEQINWHNETEPGYSSVYIEARWR